MLQANEMAVGTLAGRTCREPKAGKRAGINQIFT